MASLISVEAAVNRILVVRGKSVMLDSDLAQLYAVPTKRLNEQVRRNIKRFPEDFMFQLTDEEAGHLRSQFATSKQGGRRYLPRVFTQEGVAMLSSVLNSERAILVNIQIMRAFVQLRRMLLTNADLRRKIEAMEKRYDKQFLVIFKAIKQLLEPQPAKKKAPIGFYMEKD
jgi:hypothetical protein